MAEIVPTSLMFHENGLVFETVGQDSPGFLARA